MARPCIICTNNLEDYVRDKIKEGKQPSAIIRMVEKKYDIKLSYANIRHHLRYHDESSGTLVMATRGANKKLAEAVEIKNAAVKMAEQVQKFFDKSWGLIDRVNWEDFEDYEIDKQMKIIKDFGGLMKDYKKIEMEQQKLDQERDPMLNNMLKIMSRSASMNKTVKVEKETEDPNEEQ